MKSERENEVEFEAKVVAIEPHKVTLEASGTTLGTIVLPANEGFEKYAAGHYRKYIKVRIQMGSCMEPLPR